MKGWLKEIIPYIWYRKVSFFVGTHFTHYAKITYSQEGEDMILRSYFQQKIREKKSGFYVDIGAHHPFRYSNTYFLYKNGWNGINIDATPGSMKYFNLYRPRDINLEIGINLSNEGGGDMKDFFVFHDYALSTFDKELAKERMNTYPLSHIAKIKTDNINNILKNNIKNGEKIDLLNLDIEGLDLVILKDLDWNLFAPKVILVETYSKNIFEDEVYKHMISIGYTLFAKTTLTAFFVKE